MNSKIMSRNSLLVYFSNMPSSLIGFVHVIGLDMKQEWGKSDKDVGEESAQLGFLTVEL